MILKQKITKLSSIPIAMFLREMINSKSQTMIDILKTIKIPKISNPRVRVLYSQYHNNPIIRLDGHYWKIISQDSSH